MKIAASVTPNKTKFGPLLYPGDIERGLKELSEMGYDGIELSLRTPDDIEKKILFGLLEKYDMELLSVATGQSFIEDSLSLFSLDEEKRMEAVRRIKGYIDLVSETGGVLFLAGSRENWKVLMIKNSLNQAAALSLTAFPMRKKLALIFFLKP